MGKRYRRQDAIGTPLCVTVDGQTLEDNTVTVRHRDTMQQERVAIDALFGLVDAECSLRSLLKKIECLTGLSRVSRRVRRTASTVCFVSGMFVRVCGPVLFELLDKVRSWDVFWP